MAIVKYIFRPLRVREVGQMFDLIMSRVAWMDEVGIRQWNVTKYDECYPMSYYEEHARAGRIMILEDAQTAELLAVGLLKEEDERWADDGEPAFYLHHFATKIGHKGIGREYIHRAEAYAKMRGKHYFRLDSAIDNENLTKYYTNLGYEPCGTCVDGLYTGILRQKSL